MVQLNPKICAIETFLLLSVAGRSSQCQGQWFLPNQSSEQHLNWWAAQSKQTFSSVCSFLKWRQMPYNADCTVLPTLCPNRTAVQNKWSRFLRGHSTALHNSVKTTYSTCLAVEVACYILLGDGHEQEFLEGSVAAMEPPARSSDCKVKLGWNAAGPEPNHKLSQFTSGLLSSHPCWLHILITMRQNFYEYIHNRPLTLPTKRQMSSDTVWGLKQISLLWFNPHT